MDSRFRNSRIVLFRSASGSEHTLGTNDSTHFDTPSSLRTPPLSPFSSDESGHGTEHTSVNISSLKIPKCSNAYSQNNDDGDDGDDDDDIFFSDDDSEDSNTQYSHASLVNVDDMNLCTRLMNRSFRHGALAFQLGQGSLHAKIADGLAKIFDGDGNARASALNYICCTGGLSLLSATERDVTANLIHASSADMRNDLSVAPWNATPPPTFQITDKSNPSWLALKSSTSAEPMGYADGIIEALILRQRGVLTFENGKKRWRRKENERIVVPLSFAGAMMLVTCVLAKLQCCASKDKGVMHRPEPESTVRVHSYLYNVTFGVSIHGDGPCLLQFHRPAFYHVRKRRRYFKLVDCVNEMCTKFMGCLN